jgi:hypothetical protein
MKQNNSSNLNMQLTMHVTGQRKTKKIEGYLHAAIVNAQNIAQKMEVRYIFRGNWSDPAVGIFGVEGAKLLALRRARCGPTLALISEISEKCGRSDLRRALRAGTR